MGKTIEELLEYSVKMRKRGETYKSIEAYLSKYVPDEEVRKDLMEKLHELEQNDGLTIEDSTEESIWQKYRYTVYFLLFMGLLVYRYIRAQYYLDKLSLFILILVVGLYLFIKFKKK